MYIYNLTHILERAVKEVPNKIAFKYLNETISFKSLDIKSTQLALYFIKNGVKKGDRIGIYIPRSIESIIAVYGILKAGGVYVPLDPFSPKERTNFVINDCNIKQLVSVPQQLRKLKKVLQDQDSLNVIGLDNEIVNHTTISWAEVFKIDIREYTAIKILGDDLAYIIFTSGSTGNPKGIMHTHNSSLAFVKLVSNLYDMHDCIYGMHAPLHFDPSIQGVFAAPYALAKTIIVSDAHTKMPSSLLDLIEKEKITIWYSVPLALIQMLTYGNLDKRNISSLKWVLFSGEVFPSKHLKKLMLQWPFARFSNIYGPTETNQCTCYHVDEIPNTDATIPIGYTWGNTDFKIINTDNKEVEYGEVGELVVRSATMMKGYWNNTDLTKKSFYKEERNGGISNLYYKTGDQVKLDKKGRLLFLGRNDYQVKIRGYRIELEEINNVFTSHSAVEEAITFMILEKDNENKFLYTAILPIKGALINIEELKSYAKTKLPLYSVPTKIIGFDSFPRTASGKINRKILEEQIQLYDTK